MCQLKSKTASEYCTEIFAKSQQHLEAPQTRTVAQGQKIGDTFEQSR
jgi:hypothetical protein